MTAPYQRTDANDAIGNSQMRIATLEAVRPPSPGYAIKLSPDDSGVSVGDGLFKLPIPYRLAQWNVWYAMLFYTTPIASGTTTVTLTHGDPATGVEILSLSLGVDDVCVYGAPSDEEDSLVTACEILWINVETAGDGLGLSIEIDFQFLGIGT